MTGKPLPVVRAVIQSRMSSSRLPGKALLPVAGYPIVVLAAKRVGQRGVQSVVATSTETEDDAIAEIVRRENLMCVRGSLEDTFARFEIATADLSDDAIVARLTADNVVPDSGLILELVDMMNDRGLDYIRVGGHNAGIPYGVAAEVFRLGRFRESAATATKPGDREHVTPAMRRLLGDCQVDPVDIGPGWGRLRCTLDTPLDYDRVWRLFDSADDPIGIGWRTLCSRLGTPAPKPPKRKPNPIEQGPLVLGTVQLGIPYGAANTDGMPSDADAMRILTAAADMGVTHLDTARAYGVSEQRIGTALNRGLAERFGVVTKLRPLDEIPFDSDPGWVRAEVRLSVSESRRMLRTESFDAYLLHRAVDARRGGGAVRDAMRELRDTGVVKLTGVSIQNPDELVTALADPECGYIQMPFNLIDDRWFAPEVVDALESRPDVVYTVRSVFLQGLLVGGGAARWPTVPGLDADAISRVTGGIEQLAAELGRKNAVDLCVAYAMGQPWVTSVVLGADNAEQVADNAGLVHNRPLTLDECAHVRDRLHPVPPGLLDPSTWE